MTEYRMPNTKYQTTDIQPGDRAGPFRVVRALPDISQGGMSHLYEVEVRPGYQEPDWPQRLVLKVSRIEYQDHLKEEADFMRRFDHSNVVRIYPLPGRAKNVYWAREHFRVGWRCYYAMEWLPGGSLRQWLAKSGPLSLREAIGVAQQLAAALEHIHQRGVINLDLKPENVLLRHRPGWPRDGAPQVALCDFGIARERGRERAGVPGIGTPEYTSPEQVKETGRARLEVDHRADLFLLGITLYEMLTGQVPFDNLGLIVQTRIAAIAPSQLNPTVPPELDRVVMRLLSKRTDGRYASAQEVAQAFDAVPIPPDQSRITRWVIVGFLIFICLGLTVAAAILTAQALT